MKDPNFNIAFSIGKIHIYWFAILLALGISAAMMITDKRAKARDLPKDIALDLCLLGVPIGALGARLFACLSGTVAWSQFFDLTHPGLSFFGGVIFAALASLVYLLLRKVNVGEMLDAAAPGVFAGIGISVWGDFFNRAHYGPLVTKASLKWFPLATFGDDLKVHYAAFFYEFLLCVILIIAYYALLSKVVKNKSNRFLLMTLFYCLGRFCIDNIRVDLVKVGPLAFDQICEIVITVLCLLLLFLKRPSNTTMNMEDKLSDPNDTAIKEEAEPSAAPQKENQDETGTYEPVEKTDFGGLN